MRTAARLLFAALFTSLLGAGWLGIAATAMAAEPDSMPVLQWYDHSPDQHPVYRWLLYYDPGLQDPPPAEIAALQPAQWKAQHSVPVHAALGPRRTLWYRINLQNNARQRESLVLENTNPMTDDMQVFSLHGDTLHVLRHTAPGLRGVHAAFFSLAPGESTSLLIRISGFHSAFAPLSLHHERSFNNHQYRKQVLAGFLDGIVLGLTLYNLLLGLKTRQLMYFSYSLLGVTDLLTMAVHQNLLTDIVPLLSPRWRTDLAIVLPVLVSITLTLFIQIFFSTRLHHPRTHQYLQAYIATCAVCVLAFLLQAPLLITTPVFVLASGSASLLMLRLCLYSNTRQPTVRWLTLAGLLMPIIAGIATACAALGAVLFEKYYMEIVQLTDVLQMLAMAMAMTQRVSQLERETQQKRVAVGNVQIVSNAHNRLLAHLNHALRTPLNGIVGAAELLQHRVPAAQKHLFNMIYHTAVPLKQLVDDMTNLDAIAENRQMVHPSRFDLQNLLQECLDLFLPTAHQQNIRLFFSINPQLSCDVTGDPQRLRQILLNLVGNACKFTRNGDVGLHVSGALDTVSGQQLYHFEVIDSGEGIRHADQQLLFQSFASTASVRGLRGTGLGLSIVRELSQLLGGECGYGSNSSGGSTFWFSVSLMPHGQRPGKTHQAFAGLRVLIADDSRLLRQQLGEHLRAQATVVADAGNAVTLRQILQRDHWDLVIVRAALLDHETELLLFDNAHTVCLYADQSEALLDSEARQLPLDVILRSTSIEQFAQQLAHSLLGKQQLAPAASAANKLPLRVLVAEDIPTSQHVIRTLLETLVQEVTLCSNGHEAVALFRQQHERDAPFDVVYMDCEMPLLDGFDATANIRAYEASQQLPRTPVIALTAHTEPGYRQRSLAAGMDQFLSKPVTLAALRKSLQTARDVSA